MSILLQTMDAKLSLTFLQLLMMLFFYFFRPPEWCLN